MQFLMGFNQWFSAHSDVLAIVLAGLLSISEGLAAIPTIQHNAIYQVVIAGLRFFVKRKPPVQ